VHCVSLDAGFGRVAGGGTGNNMYVMAQKAQSSCEFAHVSGHAPDVWGEVCADQGDLNRRGL